MLDLAALMGWRAYFTWNSRHSPPGMLDLILCRPPSVVFAELKTGKRKLTWPQQEWFDLLRQCLGVAVYVWRPGDFDEIVAVLGAGKVEGKESK